jgi:hypothetical protein
MNQETGFFAGWGIFGLILAIGMLALYIWSLVWVYNDAERRGKAGWLVTLLVALLSWPISLLLWLVIRPEHRA